MGSVLGKIRTTLQNPTTTFKIGFNNKTPNPLGRKASPLNAYSIEGNEFSKDWTPSVSSVNWEPADFDPDPTGKVINAEVNKISNIADIIGDTAKMAGHIIEEKKAKKASDEKFREDLRDVKVDAKLDFEPQEVSLDPKDPEEDTQEKCNARGGLWTLGKCSKK